MHDAPARTHHSSVHQVPDSFKGEQAVDWLCNNQFAKSRAAAKELAQSLVDSQLIISKSGGKFQVRDQKDAFPSAPPSPPRLAASHRAPLTAPHLACVVNSPRLFRAGASCTCFRMITHNCTLCGLRPTRP